MTDREQGKDLAQPAEDVRSERIRRREFFRRSGAATVALAGVVITGAGVGLVAEGCSSTHDTEPNGRY